MSYQTALTIADVDFYIANVNFLGNLQLLDGTLNKEKNDKDFADWLTENFTDQDKLQNYTILFLGVSKKVTIQNRSKHMLF